MRSLSKAVIALVADVPDIVQTVPWTGWPALLTLSNITVSGLDVSSAAASRDSPDTLALSVGLTAAVSLRLKGSWQLLFIDTLVDARISGCTLSFKVRVRSDADGMPQATEATDCVSTVNVAELTLTGESLTGRMVEIFQPLVKLVLQEQLPEIVCEQMIVPSVRENVTRIVVDVGNALRSIIPDREPHNVTATLNDTYDVGHSPLADALRWVGNDLVGVHGFRWVVSRLTQGTGVLDVSTMNSVLGSLTRKKVDLLQQIRNSAPASFTTQYVWAGVLNLAIAGLDTCDGLSFMDPVAGIGELSNSRVGLSNISVRFSIDVRVSSKFCGSSFSKSRDAWLKESAFLNLNSAGAELGVRVNPVVSQNTLVGLGSKDLMERQCVLSPVRNFSTNYIGYNASSTKMGLSGLYGAIEPEFVGFTQNLVDFTLGQYGYVLPRVVSGIVKAILDNKWSFVESYILLLASRSAHLEIKFPVYDRSNVALPVTFTITASPQWGETSFLLSTVVGIVVANICIVWHEKIQHSSSKPHLFCAVACSQSKRSQVFDMATPVEGQPYGLRVFAGLIGAFGLLTVFVMPLLHLAFSVLSHIAPSRLDSPLVRRVMYSWCCLDVFVVGMFVSVPKMGDIMRIVIGHHCDGVNEVIKGYFSDVTQGSSSCFSVKPGFYPVFAALVIAAILHLFSFFVGFRGASAEKGCAQPSGHHTNPKSATTPRSEGSPDIPDSKMDKYEPPRKPHIPRDLPVVLKDLTREILRAQPSDVYAFAVAHFAQRIADRSNKAPQAAAAAKPADLQRPSQVLEERGPRVSSAASVPSEDLRLAALCTRLGARHPVSEDAFCCIEDLAERAAAEGVQMASETPPRGVRFFGVFDGHGGVATSAYASQHMWQNVVRSAAFAAGDYAKALEEGFHETEAALEPHLVAVDGMGSGACAVTAIVADGKVYVANVGDSRCVVARGGDGNPAAVAMSTDHKATEPTENRRLKDAGALVHMNRLLGVLAVSRSLGDFEIKKAARDQSDPTKSVLIPTPEIRVRDVQEGDRYLILASDGVWDAVSSDNAAELVICAVEDVPSIKAAAEKLVETAAKTSDDDITAIVVPLVV
eukprot:m51a1_g11779 hypothetical protein (1094) ;mRNA; r:284242-288790